MIPFPISITASCQLMSRAVGSLKNSGVGGTNGIELIVYICFFGNSGGERGDCPLPPTLRYIVPRALQVVLVLKNGLPDLSWDFE